VSSDAAPPGIDRAPLGHATGYPDTYDPSQLFAVARAPQRAALRIADGLPFTGRDLWTAYELTWLDARGKPVVAIATLEFSAESPALVESKSMKLYLGSFAQSAFASAGKIVTVLERDLAAVAGAPVRVALRSAARFPAERIVELAGDSIDSLPVACDTYDVAPEYLSAAGDDVAEALTTDLFRSVCPVTGQPDIASLRIAYRGPRIDRASLLRYLVSYRRHPGFHEHCVERMFVDIATHCRTSALTVHARFTRRGGIDINPFRTDAGASVPANLRTARQ